MIGCWTVSMGSSGSRPTDSGGAQPTVPSASTATTSPDRKDEYVAACMISSSSDDGVRAEGADHHAGRPPLKTKWGPRSNTARRWRQHDRKYRGAGGPPPNGDRHEERKV